MTSSKIITMHGSSPTRRQLLALLGSRCEHKTLTRQIITREQIGEKPSWVSRDLTRGSKRAFHKYIYMCVLLKLVPSHSISEHPVRARAATLRISQLTVVQEIHRPQVVGQQATPADENIAIPYLDALHILPDLAALANEEACRDKVQGCVLEAPYPRKVDSPDGASAQGGPHELTVGDGGNDSVSRV